MKICLVSSEVTPFAKTGGLADVAAALARHLSLRGHDVRLFMPMYQRVRLSEHDFEPLAELQDEPLSLGDKAFNFSISTAALPESETRVWFVRCPQLYERPDIYGDADDEHLRFALLQRAAIATMQKTGWAPDIVHANDWHAGLMPLYLRHYLAWDELFKHTRTVLTIHNIAYQGVFGRDVIEDLDLESRPELLHQEDLEEDRISFLKTGLLYADVVSTVSQTYASEIQTEEFGMGLEGLLQARSKTLVGIVNGVDYTEWDPATDPALAANYSKDDLAGKALCKQALLEEAGLDQDPEALTFGIVSRLTAQKGFELLPDILPVLLQRENIRLCVLGSGEERYERYFAWLAQSFPGKVAFRAGYDEAYAHRIEAGSDAFLMPSRFEPCGLNQMYSLRYGTVPVVRATGGLADTVERFDPEAGTGTGFVFEEFRSEALLAELERALHAWNDRDAWRAMMLRGMQQDTSWEVQIQHYEELYRGLLSV